MITAIIQFTIYALIFYGGFRLLRHHVYARGGELPDMHPGAFLDRYYVSDHPVLTTAQQLRLWVDASEASEDLTKSGPTDCVAASRFGSPQTGDSRREKSSDYPAKVLVCLGDSITHGRCSDDYVQRVRNELGKTDWEVVNAGINGDTAWNMLQRLKDVIACEPDAVTILAGTNDVSAIQTPELTAAYRRSKSIPEEVPLDLAGYIGIMRRILEQLQRQTRARIAVFTIPMIGEIADDPINRTVKQYNAELVALCIELGVTVLELHEAQHRIIEAMHRGERPSDEEYLAHIATKRPVRFAKLTGYDTKRVEREIEVAPYKRFVLMQPWQKIADSYGYYTLIDGMHLNDRGGMAAASMLIKWVQRFSDRK